MNLIYNFIFFFINMSNTPLLDAYSCWLKEWFSKCREQFWICENQLCCRKKLSATCKWWVVNGICMIVCAVIFLYCFYTFCYLRVLDQEVKDAVYCFYWFLIVVLFLMSIDTFSDVLLAIIDPENFEKNVRNCKI